MLSKQECHDLSVRMYAIFHNIHRIQAWDKLFSMAIYWGSEANNAYFVKTDGGAMIYFCEGFFKFVDKDSDDEIACVLGHEMAHGIYGSVDDESKRTEMEMKCDRLGVLYAALAGYDPKVHYKIFERAYSMDGVGLTIPADSEFRKTRPEIARKNGLWADHFRINGVENVSHKTILEMYFEGKFNHE